ncbi:hypothetical protein BH23GEM7_BH23GEM7_24010 [soil metagenome]
MERHFGHDFSRVRVYTDARAQDSAAAVYARAYTVGYDIVFAAGQYTPGTPEGRRLLAHELAHVVQQGAGQSKGMPASSNGIVVGAVNDPLEREAETLARGVSNDDGGAFRPGGGSDQSGAISRQAQSRAVPLLQRQPRGREGEEAEQKSAAKLSGCNKDQPEKIVEGIKSVKDLASRALVAFEREYPMSYESSAMTAHFGRPTSSQKATIIERYKHIRDNVEAKSYTCAAKGKTVKKGNTKVDLCGQAPCPGSSITLYPSFGSATCPAGATILHETAHNAGACDDVDNGKGYPPAESENNAYSYEYFAAALTAGSKVPTLPKRKTVAPSARD